MNERIKELAVEAFESIDYPFKQEINMPDVLVKKFAELIVGECVVALEVEIDTWKEMVPYQGSMKRKGTTAIKQHFGVEE